MKPLLLNELKQIQLDILENIHEFCELNNIKYSLACGTMLGAVRHEGYIPWDDDIDICLLRRDYNKLITLFPDVYNGAYKISSIENDDCWERPYAKAYDIRTLLKEDSSCSKTIGINIDIFPIDNVPDNYNKWVLYNKVRMLFQRLLEVKFFKVKVSRAFYKNVLLVILKILLVFTSRRKLACHISKFSQKYNQCDSKYVFENVQGIRLKKPFRRSIFDEIIDVRFENKTFKGFKNYHEYLSNVYGDYMTLPPIEKRISYHSFSAFRLN